MALFVQQAVAMDAVTPYTPAGTITPAAGNVLTAVVEVVATTATAVVADNRGNVWARGVSKQVGTYFLEIWFAVNVVNASTTVTATVSGTGIADSAIVVGEFQQDPGPIVGIGLANSLTNTSTTTPKTGSVVIDNPSIVIGAMTTPGGSPSLDAANGFTAFTDQVGSNYYRAAYKLVSIGTHECTWTLSSSQTTPGAILAITQRGGIGSMATVKYPRTFLRRRSGD